MEGKKYILKYIAKTIEMVQQKSNRKCILRRLEALAEMIESEESEARIKELEDVLGAIYEVFPRGVQDRFVDDLMKNVSGG